MSSGAQFTFNFVSHYHSLTNLDHGKIEQDSEPSRTPNFIMAETVIEQKGAVQLNFRCFGVHTIFSKHLFHNMFMGVKNKQLFPD